jgi:2'-hydroxyisoflavone reductase
MHVSNERAVGAGLTLTAPELTAKDTKDWLQGNDLASALSPELEAELIRFARDGGTLSNQPLS